MSARRSNTGAAGNVVTLRDEEPSPRLTIAELREKYKELGTILGREDLPSLPKPVPLIESWVDTRTAIVMVGATGTNKTFTLIGWACSVATGEPWLGHAVVIDPSPVIYVVGEGASKFDDRIAAWEAESGVAVPRDRLVHILRPPRSLTDPKFWKLLQQMAADIGARVIILDTFSSLAPDADETTDAAAAIRRMTDLAVAIDGAVVLAHHTGWSAQNRARGGSQLEANPDSVIVLQNDDEDDPSSTATIWRKKDKDGPSGRRIRVVRLTTADSCVLEVVDADVEAPRKKGSGGAPLASAPEIRAAIDTAIADDPDQSKTAIINRVMGECGAGRDRVAAQVHSLIEQGHVRQETRKRREGGRLVERLVWVSGPVRVARATRPATRPAAAKGSGRGSRKPNPTGNPTGPRPKAGGKP